MRNVRRSDPYFATSWYWPALGHVHFVLRRAEDALRDFDRGASGSVRTPAMMAGCYAKLGLEERAQEVVARCLAIRPEAAIGKLLVKLVFKDASNTEHLAECLRLAGMPE